MKVPGGIDRRHQFRHKRSNWLDWNPLTWISGREGLSFFVNGLRKTQSGRTLSAHDASRLRSKPWQNDCFRLQRGVH